MQKLLGIALFATVVIGLTTSCGGDPEPEVFTCSADTVTYTDIKPILDNKCATAGCHSLADASAGIDLSNYTNAKAASLNETTYSVRGSVQHVEGFSPMPSGSAKLPEAQVQLISCWIQNGCIE